MKAAPFKIQCSGLFLEGTSTSTMKLVDCPVVLKDPALYDVLYTGIIKLSGFGV